MKNLNSFVTALTGFMLIMGLSFSACNFDAKKDIQGDENHGTEQEHGDKHWSYEGETGPEKWAELSDDFKPCSGNDQSPIDIETGAETDDKLTDLNIQYQKVESLELINNGHSLQVNYPAGSNLMLDSVAYELKQFHFHVPSEHTVDGTAAAMELHFVHINKAGEIAVIGILFREGDENQMLNQFWNEMPATVGEAKTTENACKASHILPEERGYYHYMGSLTTPPCTEGVKWFVMRSFVECSAEQIKKIAEIMPKNNARPVQPLNDRELKATAF